MPAIFFGHGNPMNAIQSNGYTDAWASIGRSIPRPKAVLCVSAHWYIPAVAVTAMERPRTIHDFGGFPRELYEVKYPAPGSPELAMRAKALLGDDVALDTDSWGLDHGTWSVLCHVFPEADVPVIQLSIDETRPASWHYDLAAKLRPLSDEGVLVVGSGNIVHNLRAYVWGAQNTEPFEWATGFEKQVREFIVSGDHEPLQSYKRMGTDARLSVPTPDHYLPLMYVIALQDQDDEVTFPVNGIDGGSISMLSVQIG